MTEKNEKKMFLIRTVRGFIFYRSERRYRCFNTLPSFFTRVHKLPNGVQFRSDPQTIFMIPQRFNHIPNHNYKFSLSSL